MTENIFPLEKILAIDIKDYVDSVGRTLRQYDLRGVHSSSKEIKEFAELVPKEAEAVVNYKHQFFGFSSLWHYYQSGIALIPKNLNSAGGD